jgi:hypothetical protein
MKKTFGFSLLTAVFLSINLIAAQSLHSAINVLQQLGISEETARSSIVSNIVYTGWNLPNAAALKKISTADRAVFIRELGQYAKAYTKTDAFKQAYLKHRETRKPSPPKPVQTIDEMKKDQKESLEKAIKDTETGLPSMPKEIQAELKKSVEALKKQLKEIDNPNNPMYSKQIADSQKQQGEIQQQQYLASLAQWEKDNPMTPDKMIRQKLEEFLKETEKIDYNAALVRQPDGKMKFANSAYEEMSNIKKMCFRAGKEATDAVRSFAQEWVRELNMNR